MAEADLLTLLKVSRNAMNLPVIVLIIGALLIFYHMFSYWIPVTNNAFVVTNVVPIAADVSGYITAVYVKNGERVRKDQPLLRIYQKPYRLAYQYAHARLQQAQERVTVIERQTEKTQALLRAASFELEQAKIEFELKNHPMVREAVPGLEIKLLNYNVQAKTNRRDALSKQIAVEDQQIVEQKKRIAALKAQMNNALVNLNLTIVRAPTDGVVDNLYISVGSPVKIRTPLFSFIDTSNWWVQANFNETDLRRIRPGDEAIIMLRMYYFRRIFHGRIVNTLWAANRQMTNQRSQQQFVKNENEWLLIPQRLPLQIQITDLDPRYPLQPGASAYVYLKAHTHH